ncbi:hypothetical protein E3N88_23758 [Mikania micrantha]|uniref:CCHC-type domain-containing protein n=1 Tax=Mikania micrantha TaxID=192012 RepID=A0A5N6NG80_9ASTR|nr:hypothetical protein E3N88_23758 [Mikania micrantha]
MALLAFKPAHNVPAELSAEHDADFAPIISFLQRSRYFFALTVQPLVYESHHQQFWASCSVSSSSNGRSLVATIDAHPIAISVETICRHLKLNDAGGKVSFTKDEVALTFQSMGYEGPLPSTTYLKGRVSYNYKYLIHVFLHCLSNKSGGWDQVPSDLASAIHGLVSNQLFNFSAFIFNNLVDNISSPKKFCMYPRFLQHLFNEELGASLSLTGNTYKMPLVSSKIFVQLKKKSAQFSGTFTPLLSSMESPAPEGDSSDNPTDAEPTPSTSVPHPIKITYKRKRNPVQLSTVVQAPSTEPKQKKVKRTAQGTVLPKVKATPLVSPQVLPLKPVVALNQPESPQLMSQNITENIQRDAPIIEFASHEATSLDKRLSPKSPGSYHPEMPPTHTITQAQGTPALAVEEPLSPTTQTLMRVVTQLQARFPDPEPIQSEVGPSSSEGVNAGEAATTVDLNKDPQDSGTGNRTSPAATYIGEDFFEVLLNEGNPGCQETTSGGGGAGARLRTPSPHDSTPVEEGTSTQELTATITSLQARVAHLEAEVATLRLEVQTKDATILDLRRRPPVTLHPFHPDPATTTFISPDATKKGENIPSAGSGSEAREEEGAQEVTPSLVTLTAEWDDFLGTYFQDSSSTSSSSVSEDTREVAKETEQQTSNIPQGKYKLRWGMARAFKLKGKEESNLKLQTLNTRYDLKIDAFYGTFLTVGNGIHPALTTHYTPEQNGVAERKNMTVVEMARRSDVDLSGEQGTISDESNCKVPQEKQLMKLVVAPKLEGPHLIALLPRLLLTLEPWRICMKIVGGNFQPFGPQPNPIFGPPPNPPPLYNPPRTPQRSNQGSSDTQSTHLNRHDVPSHRANSLYQEDNIRGMVDDWDDGVVNEGDQRYQGGWDNDNHDEGYGYQGHQNYAHPNPGYPGPPRIPRRPNVNQHHDGGYDRYHDMAVNSKRQAQSSRRKKFATVKASGSSYDKVEKLERANQALEQELANLKMSGSKGGTRDTQMYHVCDHCGELGHATLDCPGQEHINVEARSLKSPSGLKKPPKHIKHTHEDGEFVKMRAKDELLDTKKIGETSWCWGDKNQVGKVYQSRTRTKCRKE